MGKWTESKALSFIIRNADTKTSKSLPNTIFVKRGAAGNRTLGAIDFINNHTKTTSIDILKEKVFEDL